MQLTTVGKEVWRGARQAERLAEAGAGDPVVQDLYKLKLVKALRAGKKSWCEIQDLVGISGTRNGCNAPFGTSSTPGPCQRQ